MNYKELGITEQVLKSLNKLGYEAPTDVQAKVIPLILDGKDVIVKSQTGSGKTGAFSIPMIERIEWEENKPQVLVLTPTRELANQVKAYIHNMGRFKRIKTVAVYGKASFESQRKDLKQKTHVVVGTPGRVMDHINRGTLDLSEVKHLVLDEADEMLNMGFLGQVEEIINELPKQRMSTLLSATMPEEIKYLSKQYMKNPTYIEIENTNSVKDRIDQFKMEVNSFDDKMDVLHKISVTENPDSCIIFCNTRNAVDDVKDGIRRKDYTAGKLHGGMDQIDRTRIMDDFRNGKFRYLVATDVAARGIDIDDISLVINFDLPFELENYVHRIGRTGRKDRTGIAYSFYYPKEARVISDIEALVETELIEKEVPSEVLVQTQLDEFEEKMNRKRKVANKKKKAINEGIIRLHINAGKKQKMRPTDIVGTLCNLDGITKDDIGIINIQDISTYFEIFNGKGHSVMKQLKKKPLKGRIRKVSIADDQNIQ